MASKESKPQEVLHDGTDATCRRKRLAPHPEEAGLGLAGAEDPSNDSDDPLDGIGFGSLFLEKFLLAIIDAHQTPGPKTRRQRLDGAMKALVGRKSSNWPLPGDLDDRALLHMANESYEDELRRSRGEISRLRSDMALAIEAERIFFVSTDEGVRKANIGRLREKFSGVYYSKQGKDKNGRTVDHRGTLRYRVVEHDYVVESLESQGLQRLKDEFAKWGIKLKI